MERIELSAEMPEDHAELFQANIGCVAEVQGKPMFIERVDQDDDGTYTVHVIAAIQLIGGPFDGMLIKPSAGELAEYFTKRVPNDRFALYRTESQTRAVFVEFCDVVPADGATLTRINHD